MKRSLNVKQREKRPENPQHCTTVSDCEQWRQSIVRELVRKVSEIQNATLGEFRIRDLNDEINKLIKEKEKWEERIRDLGGPDYRLQANKLLDTEGSELPGADGYRYFGAAKNLPKVRELFQKETPSAPKISRVDLYKRVTYSYLGYVQDMELERKEQEYEEVLKAKYLESLSQKRQKTEETNAQFGVGEESQITQQEKVNIEKFKQLHSLKLNMLYPSEQTKSKNLRIIDEEDFKGYDEEGEQNQNLEEEQESKLMENMQGQQAYQARTKEDLLKKLADKKKELLMKKYASDANVDQSQNMVNDLDD
eukprot:403361482